MARVGIFLIVVALIAGMIGCVSGPVCTLTVETTDGGSIAVGDDLIVLETAIISCNVTVGTVLSLIATAANGYHFVCWTGDAGTIADVNAASTTITMSGNYVITANFGPGASGNGTAGNPYQIADWYDLDNVRNLLTSYFIVINDLDCSSAGYEELASPTANGGKGWEPIGYAYWDPPNERWSGSTFTGTFDGCGHEIRDLFIDRSYEDSVGLFGLVNGGGVIKDTGVVNANVTGINNSGLSGVGALVGGTNGTVTSCYATGNVRGTSGAGGLVGYCSSGTVTNCHANASVTGDWGVGGLVGDTRVSTVTNCYATGNINGTWGVGGLVGYRYMDSLTNCYATGSVTGNGHAGGLVGFTYVGTVTNCYATGNVTGIDSIGGLVGGMHTSTMTNCYATGSVTGIDSTGGLVGGNYRGTVDSSFWDTQTSGQSASAGGTGKNTTEMKDIATFSGATWNITAVASPSLCNLSYIWNIVDDVTYPFLSWQPV